MYIHLDHSDLFDHFDAWENNNIFFNSVKFKECRFKPDKL